MLINDLTIKNNLYNPFVSETDTVTFLTPVKTEQQLFIPKLKQEQKQSQPIIGYKIMLAKEMVIMERVRYQVWDLLGDIGGFYDGIILALFLFMGPYSAKSFANNFVDKTRFLVQDKKKDNQREINLVNKWQEMQGSTHLDPHSFDIIEKFH